MGNWTRRGFLGSLSGAAAASALGASPGKGMPLPEQRTGSAKIRITDLNCAITGRNPTVRIVTDQGVSGYGQAESAKPYLKPMVMFYKNDLIGEDPTDVARIMLKIRRKGAFKPWGAAVSAIEIALWDIAGQVAGLPDPIVKNGFIEVWDKPGLGITFNVKAAKAHLRDEDRDFFD